MASIPLVTIIIPTYNRAHLIGETLDSVIAQTYPNWECIVVDDGSTDHTEDVMAEYVAKDSRIRFYHRPPEHKPGGNGARNYGFRLSRGVYVQWFDSDDLMHPEKIERQVMGLAQSEMNFSVCQAAQFENNIKQSRMLSKATVSDHPLDDYIANRIRFMTPTPIFRKQFLLKNKLRFNEDLKASQEWDFFVRLLKVESKYLVDSEVLVFYRKHADSISYSADKALEKERLAHYFLARFQFLQETSLEEKTRRLIEKDLLRIYKKTLKSNLLSEGATMYRKFILNRSTLSVKKKIYAGTAWFSYLLFNRGEIFLKRF